MRNIERFSYLASCLVVIIVITLLLLLKGLWNNDRKVIHNASNSTIKVELINVAKNIQNSKKITSESTPKTKTPVSSDKVAVIENTKNELKRNTQVIEKPKTSVSVPSNKKIVPQKVIPKKQPKIEKKPVLNKKQLQSKTFTTNKKINDKTPKETKNTYVEENNNTSSSLGINHNKNAENSSRTVGESKAVTKVDKSQALAELLALAQKYKKYPRRAQRSNIEGKCVLTVHITASGIIEKSNLSKPCGNLLLNKATTTLGNDLLGKAIKSSGDSYTVNVPIIYKLNN